MLCNDSIPFDPDDHTSRRFEVYCATRESHAEALQHAKEEGDVLSTQKQGRPREMISQHTIVLASIDHSTPVSILEKTITNSILD